MRIEQDYGLEKHNTFHLPVKTQYFVEYQTEQELQTILSDEYFQECRILHIGSGSNLLFFDNFAGIVLHSAIKGIEKTKEDDKNVYLRVGAGVIWDDLVAYAVQNGWGGIENLSLIPGETGAAAIQNIGAYGAEVKDVIETVEAFERSTRTKRIFTREECNYGYRSSIFKTDCDDKYIVTYVTVCLSKQPGLSLSYGNLKEALAGYSEVSLATVREAIISIRRQKLPDPEQCGNAGSFFMNPVITNQHFEKLRLQYPSMPSYPASDGKVKIPAGWLIEQCGFKGKSYGTVGVYEKQALVLVNLGNATGTEISMLAESIRMKVSAQFEIEIVPEVKYIV